MQRAVVLIFGGFAAIGLHGCGGDGPPTPSTTCLASYFDFPTQSVAGNATINVSVSANGRINSITQPFNWVAKMDFEKFRFRSDVSMTSALESQAMVMDATIIFDANKTTMALFYNQTADDKIVSSNCSLFTFSPRSISDFMAAYNEVYMPALRGKAICEGSEGSQDSWKFDDVIDVNVSDEDGSDFTLNGPVNVTFKMTENSLLQSVHIDTTDKLWNGTQLLVAEHVVAHADVMATADGPSDVDMDWTQFGVECVQMPSLGSAGGFVLVGDAVQHLFAESPVLAAVASNAFKFSPMGVVPTGKQSTSRGTSQFLVL